MGKVLVIEDDPDMREIERVALTCGGHEVLVAANGNEGLRALERERPCVILLDLMMPGMEGLTFLVERRRGRVCVEVPVVCVSAGGPEMMAQRRPDQLQYSVTFSQRCSMSAGLATHSRAPRRH